MEPEDDIIKQLKEQNIEFNLLQKEYIKDKTSEVSKTVKRWKDKFIANREAPHLDYYLWHIFSYGSTKYIEGEKATEEYLKQFKTKVLIFNEPQQYLIECLNAIPNIEMDDFFDDIYICHHNMKWTDEPNPNTLTVIPNPASNFIGLNGLNLSGMTNAVLYNLNGQRVKRLQISANSPEISVEDWEAGLYFIDIIQAGAVMGQLKFVKTK